MPRLAILSDTHVPSRAGAIPDWVREEIERADHTIHAGDFDSPDAYETVRDLASELTAVSGNMDPASLSLAELETTTVGGVSFVVTHGTGPVHNYRDRVAETVREVDADAVGIAGHTHEVLDRRIDGVRVLNPGSATGASPASETSMMIAIATDGDLDVDVRRE